MIFVPVFDSSTKLPSGLLDGNVLQMGNYDECLGVKGPSSPATNEPRFTGLYCRVRITELNLPPLTSSLQQFASGEMPLELNRTHVLHYMHLPLQHSLVKSQVRFSQNFDQTAVYVDEMLAPWVQRHARNQCTGPLTRLQPSWKLSASCKQCRTSLG